MCSSHYLMMNFISWESSDHELNSSYIVWPVLVTLLCSVILAFYCCLYVLLLLLIYGRRI